MKKPQLCLITLVALVSAPAISGEVDIVNAHAVKNGPDRYHFSVTLKHQDTGWEHYANQWDVYGLDGTRYGSRVLLHPHVNEQPFTRSLSNVHIPAEVNTVIIKAYDSVHGQSPEEFQVSLPD